MRILPILLLVLLLVSGALHSSPPVPLAGATSEHVHAGEGDHADGGAADDRADLGRQELPGEAHGHVHLPADLTRGHVVASRDPARQPVFATAHPTLGSWSARVPVQPPAPSVRV